MDKYKISFYSGVLAGVIYDFLDYISFLIQRAFNIKHVLNANYMVAALLQGKASNNPFEFISGQIFHLIFSGGLGCAYIIFLTCLREKSTMFRGWLFGGVIPWFLIFMIGNLYRIELFVKAGMNTVVSDFITASVFGIILSIVYKRFEVKSMK